MGHRGRWVLAGVTLSVLAVLGYRSFGTSPDGADPIRDPAVDGRAPEGKTVATDADSPFATAPDATRDGDVAGVPLTEDVLDLGGTEPSGSSAAAPLPAIDVREVGRSNLSDTEFESLVARLASDPELLAALIDEFRSETDPERRRRLALLLGDVRDPAVSVLAAELIYSGDPDSRALGLDLLGRIQPGNGDARDMISGLLSSESDGEVLVGTLTAMAVPGAVEPGERRGLAEQVSLLTNHADPAVRRTSLDILSRWSDSPEHTPLLLGGLVDGDPIVRRTAAYALVGHEDASEDVMRDLFAVVENTSEVERTRRGAILALKGMPLDDERRRRLEDIENRLDLR